jgi:PAS domain S-box-containing protein
LKRSKAAKEPKKQSQRPPSSRRDEVADLREKLRLADEAMAAVRSGGVDALVVSRGGDAQIYTLRGAEEPYRLFVEAMSEGAITVSPDGTIMYANKAFAELVREPLERVIGGSIQRFISAYDKDTFNALFFRAQQGAAKAELLMRRSDEELISVYVSLRDFKEFGARAVCMVVTDLTEQKRDQLMLAEGKLAKLIVDQAAEAIAVCDANGTIIMGNRILNELAGQNVLFQDFNEHFTFTYSDNRGDGSKHFQLREVVKGTVSRGVEVFYVRDEEEIPLLLSAAPIKLPGGPLGCVVTLFNIEERKRAEATLRKSEKLAATGQLAATIAHEINNPLEAVTNLLFLVGMQDSLPAQGRIFLEQAEKELARIAHITRQTLAFHRESTEPLPVNIKEMVDSVAFLYERRFKEKGVALKLDVRFNGKLYCFENEIRQLLSNLVVNALDATPKGGRVLLRVRPAKERRGRRNGVRLVVADTGKGITPEHRAKIFSPFFTTKGEKGTGLGLWVSEAIVHKHNGSLRMRSTTRRGKSGTVFSLFLPLRGMTTTRRTSAVA